MTRIKTVLVRYRNGSEKIVPVEQCENFNQNTKEDFRPQKCKVWLKGTKGKDDYLYNAFILLAGSNQADIESQKKAKRVRYPNMRTMSFSSFNGVTKKTKASRKKVINNNKIAREETRQHVNKNIVRNHDKLIQNRSLIISSSSSENSESETDATDKNGLERSSSQETAITSETEDFESDADRSSPSKRPSKTLGKHMVTGSFSGNDNQWDALLRDLEKDTDQEVVGGDLMVLLQWMTKTN